MPPTVMTQSAGRPVVESQGGGTGERVGRSGRNGNENVQENVGNVIVNGNRVGCSYKEFLACNPKEYDGKGGAAFLTRWIEKMEFVHDMSGCSVDQKVKYTVGSFVSKALTWWNSQIRTLSQEVAISMFQSGRGEDMRNGSIKKVEKRGNVGEPSKDKNDRDDNKRTRTGNAFATTVNPVGRKNTGTRPKCTTCNSYHVPGGPCRACFNYNRLGYLAKDCRGVPRNVNPINARNLTVRACYERGSTDHVRNQGKQARGMAFMLGTEEARQDPNIVTGTFTLNDHFATTLFDFGADYSFDSTTFIPLLGLDLSDLGFKYEIEIASGQLVEIDKVIKGCKLEIEGHVFDIDLIPFGHGSFDVIISMDWLSNYKDKIIFHEKVVRIPLPDGKVLRVLGESQRESGQNSLMSAKASEKKKEEIIVVRDFPEVFPDDLSGLPPIREIEFWIELTPGATSVAKSRYRLVPFELAELSGQLKELQDKGFIPDQDHRLWGAPPVRLISCRVGSPRTLNWVRSFLGWAGVLPLSKCIKDRIWRLKKEVVDEFSVRIIEGVERFRKKGKLAPRFVGPFEIIEKVGPVAYRLDLPEELNGVHDTFHVSNLKKCLADPTLQVPLDEIRVDAKLNFLE
ncbi:putative reverse transcriptase domain-containing protein [Tanacetum coccineum]|uniref:Reverse transcriptase domain-containing protein n=1 Tax=Tanacetum coccineum TaxID=301880 RepID=A0ABQ5IBJ4_9ASTR